MNSGAVRVGDHFIRFHTMRGMSDIIGQMRDGRFIAIEVKTARGRLEPDQAAFLSLVQSNGGVAGVARNAQQAYDIISLSVAQA